MLLFGQETGTGTHDKVHGHKRIGTAFVRTMTPRLTCYQTVDAAHGRYQSRKDLAPDTLGSRGTVVDEKVGQAVGDLTQLHAAERSGHQVVDGGRLRLHEEFPHQTSSGGEGNGLPEVHPIATGSIEIQRSMIRMRHQVGREFIRVPDGTCLEIVLDRTAIDAGEVFVHRKTVEGPDRHVQAKHLTGCQPRLLRHKGGRVAHVISCIHFWEVLRPNPLGRKQSQHPYPNKLFHFFSILCLKD